MRRRLRALSAALLFLAACRPPPALDFGAGLDVPYIQTPPAVVHRMLSLAAVQPGELVIDLGCGDGRISIAAARHFHARSIGYDLDPARIREARAAARAEPRASFVLQNLFDAPIGRANVVTLFLTPAVLESLRPRLRAELGPGSRVVSHSFPIRTWTPTETVHLHGRTLYLYRLPQSLPPSIGGLPAP